jgi:membrane associated rhomboid family serine protease
MRTALRILGRLACWALVVVGALALVLFFAALLSADNSSARLGLVILMIAALLVLAGGIWGLRRPRLRRAAAERYSDARRRLRAGEPVVLRPSRRRWAMLLLVSLVLVVGFVLGFAATPQVILGLCAVFFGACTLIAALQLIPGRAYLRIAPEGLLIRGPLKTERLDWNDVEHFWAYEIQHQYISTKHVGFDRRELTPQRQGLWATVARGMSGVDRALPDTYGVPHDGLADLLSEARDRYASEHGLSPSARADLELAAEAAQVRQDRLPVVAVLLACACVIAFMVEAARYDLFPSTQELLDVGATSRDTLADGRWWTLLSANVLHGDPIHLLLNLVGFAIVGTLLEREVGWARFGLLCLASAIAAMGVAVLLSGAVVVGISGVIFAGAAWAVLRDAHRTRALGHAAWAMLPAGVIYTFLAPRISIGAHVGGLLAGLALGYAFERRPAQRRQAALGARG